MFTKLLVPLDRSSLAEQAIGPAAAIARACHAGIDLVLVHEPFPFVGYSEVLRDSDEWAAEHTYVEKMAAELTAKASVPTTSVVLRGAAAEMICARAKEAGCDLVVMTSHGRTGFSRTWLGSVADAVMRHASIPVLMLRPTEGPATRTAAEQPFKHVLVTLDGSALAADILPAATALAQASGASLTLLRVVPPVPLIVPIDPALPIPNVPLIPDEAATRWLVDETRKELQEIAQRRREECGVAVDAHVVVNQHAAAAIIDFVRAHEIDVVAMSTHGRGASRWLLGSVADKVLRASGVPVLLRRPLAAPGESALVTSSTIAEQLPALSGR